MISKEDILQEIRRTANENNGVPLGQKAFTKETGINPYYWTQYWARFSDALREAGLPANKWKTAYPDELLIEEMIGMIRKFKRYPTLNELKVERISGVDIHYDAIRNRKQVDFVRKIIDYCSEKQGYDDILGICDPLIEKLESKLTDDFKDGYEVGEVYLYKSGRYYKIGKTNNIVRRGTELRIILPDKTLLIHSIKTDDPSGVELYWHRRFESKRKNGEWFDLGPLDVKAFKRWRRIA